MNLTNLLLVAAGGFVLYEFFLAPASQAAQGSASSSGGSTSSSSSSSSSTSSATPSLAQQIQGLAGNVTQANPDVWTYYYNQVLSGRGTPAVTGAQMESILQALGLTDATRGTAVTLAQYIGALGKVGLSGIGRSGGVGRYGSMPGFGR